MTVVSKAALAAELGVTKARVSQYVKRGLPVRSDGKLDREEAVKWVADNHVDRGNGRAVGAKRAAAAAKRVKPTPLERPLVDDFRDLLIAEICATLTTSAARIAGDVALKLGVPVKTAFIVEQLVDVQITKECEVYLDQQRVSNPMAGGLTRFERLCQPSLQAREAEWPTLAEIAGETYDEDAWWQALDPYLTPTDA